MVAKKLYLGGVSRVHVDASIHQRAMHIRHHATHIAGRVRSGLLLLEVVHRRLHSAVPSEVVALVDRVNRLADLGDGHALRGEDKLTDGRVQGEALHAVAVCEDQLGSAAVGAVAGADDLRIS